VLTTNPVGALLALVDGASKGADFKSHPCAQATAKGEAFEPVASHRTTPGAGPKVWASGATAAAGARGW